MHLSRAATSDPDRHRDTRTRIGTRVRAIVCRSRCPNGDPRCACRAQPAPGEAKRWLVGRCRPQLPRPAAAPSPQCAPPRRCYIPATATARRPLARRVRGMGLEEPPPHLSPHIFILGDNWLQTPRAARGRSGAGLPEARPGLTHGPLRASSPRGPPITRARPAAPREGAPLVRGCKPCGGTLAVVT